MKRALIIVDVQNDFLPNGALPVAHGDEIISVINELQKKFDLVVATKDWHPANHGSFAVNHIGKKTGETIELSGLDQILWPVHCVQNTSGAEFAKDLITTAINRVFYKGTDSEIDSYSTFFDNAHRRATGLGEYLKESKVTDVYIVGLATDYCVKYSALDACHLRFNVYVVTDACRGVNLMPEDSEKAFQEMQQAGAQLITSQKII